MSLSIALNTARSSLATTAKQLAVSGGNIANADDPNRTRRISVPSSDGDGSVRLVSVSRATDLPVFYRLLSSRATTSGQNSLLDGITRLSDTIGDTADGSSPAARLAALATALQAQANASGDRNLAQASLTAAQQVVSTLSLATTTVNSVRNKADADMADSVGRLNDLLAQLTVVNNNVVRKTIAGEDASDALDKRDSILGQISDEAGISIVSRANNDIAVYTDGGVTLFDKSARSVSFELSTALGPGIVGKAVYIDGVSVTGANASMALQTGNIAGLASLRDTVAPAYQAQLDEVARSLVEAFAESDQSGGGGPNRAGLLTWPGGPVIPPAGTLVSGLAGSLSVNAAVDPSKGGNLDRIRDGGINGANYSYNAGGAAGYGARLDGIVASINTARTFDSAAGPQSGVSVLDFATGSVSWLEDQRKTASDTADYQNALLSRTQDALSNSTGVNIDDEYATQLQLEQSYQASSKLIAVINRMFDTLLEAVG